MVAEPRESDVEEFAAELAERRRAEFAAELERAVDGDLPTLEGTLRAFTAEQDGPGMSRRRRGELVQLTTAVRNRIREAHAAERDAKADAWNHSAELAEPLNEYLALRAQEIALLDQIAEGHRAAVAEASALRMIPVPASPGAEAERFRHLVADLGRRGFIPDASDWPPPVRERCGL